MMDASTSSMQSAPILARVIDVQDPEGVGRVQVIYPPNAEGDDISTTEWAMVAVPFAGNDYGAFMLPGVDDL
ncbi:MAG: phage baseplate assembly protein V, partial [Pseudomonadota bacterium]